MTIAPVTLYGLSLEKGQNINVGPYAWKTAVDLGVLGVPYQLVGLTFEEIRTTFEKETGNPKIAVPAIQDGDRWISDSFVLAQYLEAKYATKERTLFPQGEAFARFLNTWADKDLGDQIVPLFAPWLYQAQSPESSAWFLKRKVGNDQAKIDFLIKAVQDPEFVEKQVSAVRDKLATIERYLAENKAAGNGRFLAGTEYPTHADAAVWGWYVATVAIRGDLDLENRIWKHESLPLVRAWVEAVKEESGVEILVK